MTKEEIKAAFESHESITDGILSYWMNTATGQIFGNCCHDTCEVEYINLDDFLEDKILDHLEIN